MVKEEDDLRSEVPEDTSSEKPEECMQVVVAHVTLSTTMRVIAANCHHPLDCDYFFDLEGLSAAASSAVSVFGASVRNTQ